MKTFSRYVSQTNDAGWRRPRATLLVIGIKAAADAISKAVTLFVLIAAARTLGAADFGVLALAMTTGWLLSVVSDAGLSIDLARRVAAAAAGQRRSIVRRTMRLRGRLAVIAAGAGAALAYPLAPPEARAAFAVIVGAQLVSGVLETLAHAFRGMERAEIDAGLGLAHRLGVAAAAAVVLLQTPSPLLLGMALMLPPAGALIAGVVIARRLFADDGLTAGDGPAFDATTFRREIAPIGAGILLSALYFRCDLFFIERWHGVDAVGLYTAAFRSVEALRLLPAAALAVVFPQLCRAVTLATARSVATALLLSAVVPALILATSADRVLSLVYGPRFAAAAPALSVLALSVPFFFVNYALTHQLIAWGGQRWYLGITAAALLVNLIANALLIPAQSLIGAAWATLVTEAVVALGCAAALVSLTRQPQLARMPPSVALAPGELR